MEPLVRRIHHCAFRTRDVEEAASRWALLYGLTPVDVTPERALLRCADEDYGLELLHGEEPGHDHTAYELVQGLGLDDVERHLLGHGLEARREKWPIGHSESVQLTDVAGFGVELVEYVEPADRRPFEAKQLGAAGTASGHHPRKMGHVNVLCEDAGALARFYTSVLGFGVSDWIGDGAVWLHVDHDHHVFAALEKPVPHFHHVAFEVADIAVMRAFLDHVAQHDRWVTWGPGPARDGAKSVQLRAHARGGHVRGALLRHGAPAPRPPAAPVARRRALVERLGHPAAAHLLPLRRRRAADREGAADPARRGVRAGVTHEVHGGRVRVIGPSGEPAWGIQDGDRIVLEESASGPGERAVIESGDATFLPPFDERPSKIVAVHLNYPSRIEEYAARTPDAPSYFLKPPSSLSAHRRDVARPAGTAYLNYEGEIALVIGRAVPPGVARRRARLRRRLHGRERLRAARLPPCRPRLDAPGQGPGRLLPDRPGAWSARTPSIRAASSLRTYVNGQLVQEGSSR